MPVNIGKSARYYMERRLPDFQQTLRRPAPRADLNFPRLPLTNPPNPDALHGTAGQNPPDGPLTLSWPFGQVTL